MQFLIGFMFGGGLGIIGAALLIGIGSKDQYLEGYFDGLYDRDKAHRQTEKDGH